MEKTDTIIIGAGAVGLAVASFTGRPGRSVMLFEKYESFGRVTSSRNSEVIHASVYYPENSLKARLCAEGNRMIYDICRKARIMHKNTGKLIVAVDESEVEKLPAMLDTALRAGAEGARIVERRDIKAIDPKVDAPAAIWFPSSGIVDSHAMMQFFEADASSKEVDFVYNAEIIALDRKDGGYEVTVRQHSSEEFRIAAKTVVNCAGLGASRIAELVGIDIDSEGYRTGMRKGMYCRATGDLSKYPDCLIYPVPPLPDTVGIHSVPDCAGGMRLGPLFVSTDEIEYSVTDEARIEIIAAMKKMLPFINPDNVTADSAGIQPDLHKFGEEGKDFVIRHEIDRGFPGFFNLLNIGSPGLTSSPAIGKKVAGMIDEYFRYF